LLWIVLGIRSVANTRSTNRKALAAATTIPPVHRRKELRKRVERKKIEVNGKNK
jgi:hypothetical protein